MSYFKNLRKDQSGLYIKALSFIRKPELFKKYWVKNNCCIKIAKKSISLLFRLDKSESRLANRRFSQKKRTNELVFVVLCAFHVIFDT